jgi:MarR family transcriptional regulator, 2-MHQ and catechol-resistance regulon repressor
MSKLQVHRPDPALESAARELRGALSELMRVYSFRDRDRICCYDISVTQSNALDALVARGPLTLNDLAASLYLEKSTTSRIADGLENKGYATRQVNPESKRSILIEVTAEGARLQQRIERDLLEEEMRLLEDFDPEVRQAAARLVARVARAAASRVNTTGGTCCAVA